MEAVEEAVEEEVEEAVEEAGSEYLACVSVDHCMILCMTTACRLPSPHTLFAAHFGLCGVPVYSTACSETQNCTQQVLMYILSESEGPCIYIA